MPGVRVRIKVLRVHLVLVDRDHNSLQLLVAGVRGDGTEEEAAVRKEEAEAVLLTATALCARFSKTYRACVLATV